MNRRKFLAGTVGVATVATVAPAVASGAPAEARHEKSSREKKVDAFLTRLRPLLVSSPVFSEYTISGPDSVDVQVVIFTRTLPVAVNS